jgi:hypothetical protein
VNLIRPRQAIFRVSYYPSHVARLFAMQMKPSARQITIFYLRSTRLLVNPHILEKKEKYHFPESRKAERNWRINGLVKKVM